jgi:hypothetical protein
MTKQERIQELVYKKCALEEEIADLEVQIEKIEAQLDMLFNYEKAE